MGWLQTRTRSGCRWLAMVVLLVGLTRGAIAADPALDDYNLAVQLYKQSRWTQAGDTFRKFLAAHATHEKAPFARLYLGLTLVNQSDYKAARDTLRGFVTDYPKNQNLPQAKYRIAECSYLLNDLPTAQTELQTYLADHPQDALVERALPYLGDVQLRLNDAPAAEKTFADAIQRFPNGPLIDDARFGLAKSFETQKRIDDALKQYRDLSQGKGPRAAEAQFQIGTRHFEQQQFADSAAAYRDLVERFPESPLGGDARLNAGFALYRAGQFADAATQFASAANVKGKEIPAGYWRGLSLKGAGDYAQAADVLTALSKQIDTHPLAEAVLFQRGMCERLAGRAEPAQKSLMEVVETFPNGDLADDALHFAGELAIEAGDLATATARLTQFDKNYPRSGLRMHQDLLSGRLALLQASKAPGTDEAREQYVAAAKKFEVVLKDSTLPRTRAQARYYLALTAQLQGEHPRALEAIGPLVEELDQTPELADALVLKADSLLQLQQAEPAVAALDRYLTKFPNARQTARALSLTAVAQSRVKNHIAAQAALERLATEFPKSPFRANTVLQLAEWADERMDWPVAAEMYRQLQPLAAGTDNEVFAIRGLGLALFQQKKFIEAADALAIIPKDFATHRLAAEASYYHAEALREAGQLPEAAAAFTATFTRGAPTAPPLAGDEQKPPLVFAYRAGLQAARTHKQALQIAEADQAYAALLQKFPQPQHLDRVLDEWALLNYEAQRYEQADALFRRLIQETPNSDLVDNARLSLAESDLLAERLEPARTALEALVVSERSDAEVKERAQFQLIVLSLDQQKWIEVRERAGKYLADHPAAADRPYVAYCRLEAQLADPLAPSEEVEKVLKELAEQIAAPTPATVPAWYPRLWVLQAEGLFRLKKYADIGKTLADFQQKLPQAPLAYQLEEVVGRAYKQQAEWDKAREAFARVIADPAAFRTETAAKSQFLIGETYLLQENWAEAFLAYQKVYASYAFPEWQAEALLQSGKCDEQQGQWAEAAKTYRRLLDEFPNYARSAEAKQRLDEARKRAMKK
jgi:TolA-binding protein